MSTLAASLAPLPDCTDLLIPSTGAFGLAAASITVCP